MHQTALYRQFSVPMFRVLLRYAKDKSEAEDMLQDGFVRVYRDMGQFRGDGALGGWIRRIMVNTALSHLRKQREMCIRDSWMTNWFPRRAGSLKYLSRTVPVSVEKRSTILPQNRRHCAAIVGNRRTQKGWP